MDLTPTRDDPFSFGPEVQEALAVAKLADLGAYGVTFHDVRLNQLAIDHLTGVR